MTPTEFLPSYTYGVFCLFFYSVEGHTVKCCHLVSTFKTSGQHFSS